jgi:hypothetical protein
MLHFQKIFLKYLQEDISAGSGGAFGDTSGGYADGDSRVPKILGGIITRPGLKPKSKKKRKKKRKKVLKSSYRAEKGVDIRVISPKLPT